MPARTLAVISTLVWDVIHPRHDDAPSEGWGGATYSLSALDAALDDEWRIAPVMKVGRDRADAADAFLRTLRHDVARDGLVVVEEENNRSILRYLTEEHRDETLGGGVPAWSWPELRGVLERLRPDALHVNFLGGWEIDLATAKTLRAWFAGPIYADIHMMVWKPGIDGHRVLTPVEHADEWFACFDIIQVNEDEMRMLAGDGESFARRAFEHGARCTAVTIGKRGVAWSRDDGAGGRISGITPPERVMDGPGTDPTGCGDVWGATFHARLVSGDAFDESLRAANRAASLNAAHQGVVGLAERLGS